MAKLQRHRQGKNQTVDEFNTTFRILIQKAGLDETENAGLLIQMYSQGLNRELAKRIIIQGPPAVLSEWMTKASTLDGYERRANQFFANAIYTPSRGSSNNRGKPWKPKMYTRQENTYMGEPMQIDRLDPQEEKRCRENKLCFNCGKPGHFASECRQGGSSNGGQGNSKGKGPQHPGKKREFQGNRHGGRQQKGQVRTVEQEQPKDKEENMRNKISKIINDAYENRESPDYLRFVEQVEKMGF